MFNNSGLPLLRVTLGAKAEKAVRIGPSQACRRKKTILAKEVLGWLEAKRTNPSQLGPGPGRSTLISPASSFLNAPGPTNARALCRGHVATASRLAREASSLSQPRFASRDAAHLDLGANKKKTHNVANWLLPLQKPALPLGVGMRIRNKKNPPMGPCPQGAYNHIYGRRPH